MEFFEKAAVSFSVVLCIAAIAIMLMLIWDFLLCPLWMFLRSLPSEIRVGDRVRALPDYKHSVPDIPCAPFPYIEGVVRETNDGKLIVRTDEGNDFNCLANGTIVLRDKG